MGFKISRIDEKVSVFVDVSNPNTISYTQELRSILDNMTNYQKSLIKEEIDIPFDIRALEQLKTNGISH